MTRSQHRTLRIVALTTAIVIATPFMLSMALMTEPHAVEPSPSRLIRSLDAHAFAGEWAAFHNLFAYEHKGRTVLPDLWAAALPKGVAAAVKDRRGGAGVGST